MLVVSKARVKLSGWKEQTSKLNNQNPCLILDQARAKDRKMQF